MGRTVICILCANTTPIFAFVIDCVCQEGKDGGTTKDRIAPWSYEFAHNHCITTFRLYYNGSDLDPTFPAPLICPESNIPPGEPIKAVKNSFALAPKTTVGVSSSHHSSNNNIHANSNNHNHATMEGAPEMEPTPLDVTAILEEATKKSAEERRLLLQEVRHHLDLLKEFEGVISDEDIAKRKRELFLALPSAPASSSSGNTISSSSSKKTKTFAMEHGGGGGGVGTVF
jgi:hypothetical protein